MAIYLKKFKNTKPNSLIELIQTLYQYSNTYSVKSIQTYNDVNCTDLECDEDKFRSADALVELCKTYFPNTTEKEIFTALVNTIIILEDKRFYLILSYCTDICKPVFYFYQNLVKSDINYSIDDANNDNSDEDGYYYENKSEYESWEQIMKIIGFNKESLYSYLEELNK